MTQYRVKNWSEYNRSLVNRGNLELYISNDVLKKWKGKKTGKAGRPSVYSDDMILCALMLREVFSLKYRALQGFLTGLLSMMKLNLSVPHYTRICRRAANLGKTLRKLTRNRPQRLVFDSTGFKVLGDGEWLARKHGCSRKRKWRKVHVAMCPDTHEIILIKIDDRADPTVFPDLFKKAPRSVREVYGDGAYDAKQCRRLIDAHGARSHIPPPKHATLLPEASRWAKERNDALREITGLGGGLIGRSLWGRLSGYSTRSVVETTMSRLKRTFGSSLKNRLEGSQVTEIIVKALTLNKMNKIGLPLTEPA